MDVTEARQFIEQSEWIYAKSYSKTLPHYYTTRKKINNDKLFEDFLSYIRENGILKSFYSKQYIYLELDGYDYWEMGRPIKAVQVLNRAKIDINKKYRISEPEKIDEIILKEKLLERENYLENLLNKKNKTEKDKKQINFLLDHKRRINGGGKNIIDHSNLKIKYE